MGPTLERWWQVWGCHWAAGHCIRVPAPKPRPLGEPTTSCSAGRALQAAGPPDRAAQGPGPGTQQAGARTSPLVRLEQPGPCLQGSYWHLGHSGSLWALSVALYPARSAPRAPRRALAGDGWILHLLTPHPVLPGFLLLPHSEPLV